ncbi:MAG: hypothetical protein LBP22_04770 [Deltaproteobacteria bacterium]|jgi:LSD1 subclass zinc finger protein|nr:hypothetical protein [Deltaproteobacteria bacterium]
MEEISHNNCKSCGATLELKPGEKTITCPYCGTVNYLFEEPEKGSLMPEVVVPAEISKQDLHNFIHHTMILDESAPDDILELSQIESEIIAFYPIYTSKGHFKANWTASFGYDRQEPYTVIVTEYSNGRPHRVPTTRYRTVTDWSPASGEVNGYFQVSVYGGAELPKEVASLLSQISTKNITGYQKGHVAGYDLKPLTIDLKAAQGALAPLIDQEIANEVYAQAQGDHQKNWKWSSKLENTVTSPGLAPLARGTFTYQGKTYNIWADGVSLTCKYTDKLPQDVKRMKQIRLSYVPLYLVLATAGACYFLVENSFNYWPIGTGLALAWLYGLIRSKSISGYSRKRRLASLARKKMEEETNADQRTDEEREALLKATQDPVQPFFAKTKNDLLVLPLTALIAVTAVLIGVFKLDLGSSFSSAAYRKPAASSQAVPPSGRASDSPSGQITGGTIPKSSDSARTQSSSERSAARQARFIDRSGLNCSDDAIEICKTKNGRLVDGLVGTMSTQKSSGRKYLRKLANYKSGRAEGVSLTLFPDGQVQWLQSYVNGYLQGTGIRFYPQSVKAEGDGVEVVVFFKQGQMDGMRFDFDTKGRLEGLVDAYVKGQPEGTWYEFYPDGSVRSEEQYVNGQVSGTARTFTQGQKQSEYDWVPDVVNQVLTEMARDSEEIIGELKRISG